MSGARALNLPGYSLFAALLASAGLPIYIHAPKFYVDEYGVSLAALGAVLFGLRMIDFVQDPLLGFLSDRFRAARRATVLAAAGVMAAAMLGLFAVAPPVGPLVWFALTLTALFTGFSFLTISFYAQGVTKAGELGPRGHLRLAGWRETGALLGVCAAAVAPVVLGFTGAPFAWFAAGFAALALLAVLTMRREWSARAAAPQTGFRAILRDAVARRLLLIALFNAAPVAVTSTLFLFFVESRLSAAGWEGPLLLLFFLAAAASAPGWSRAAQALGAKPVLLAGMALSILAFGFAATLGAGDIAAFAAICLASGAALGADMTLLPAIFAGRMARLSDAGGQAFGMWSFVSKLTLALAAVTLLPALQASGFRPGSAAPDEALLMLSVLYALVPCGLKAVAIVLLALTPVEQ